MSGLGLGRQLSVVRKPLIQTPLRWLQGPHGPLCRAGIPFSTFFS
jgi:hypothetical protein